MASEVSRSLAHAPGETASYYFGPLITEREMGILEWDDFALLSETEVFLEVVSAFVIGGREKRGAVTWHRPEPHPCFS